MKTLYRTAFIIFLLDQASKWVVVRWLDLRRIGEIDVFPPLLNFRMAWNPGINFGLLTSNSDAMRWILITVALLIAVWVVLWVRAEKLGRLGQISAGLLVGGALGNVIDRLTYGAVADFINTTCCGFENPYAFNIADISIFAGAIGLILFSGGKTGAKKQGNKTP